MDFDVLDDKTFFLYAAHNYSNPQCTGIEDFYDDLKSIKYLKRLFNRYLNKGELKLNLICNHLILLSNVFSVEASTRMLFFKLEREYWTLLKPILMQFNHLPEVIRGVGKHGDILTVDIPLDNGVIKQLRGT
jgi:membrane-bound lytic murein transglycosylase MltF